MVHCVMVATRRSKNKNKSEINKKRYNGIIMTLSPDCRIRYVGLYIGTIPRRCFGLFVLPSKTSVKKQRILYFNGILSCWITTINIGRKTENKQTHVKQWWLASENGRHLIPRCSVTTIPLHFLLLFRNRHQHLCVLFFLLYSVCPSEFNVNVWVNCDKMNLVFVCITE